MTETTPRPGRRGTIALVLASVSLALSLATCGASVLTMDLAGADRLPVQSPPEPAEAIQVEAVGHVTLPPGTVLLGAAYSNGLETRLNAQFRIPRAELDAFLASGRFTAELTEGLRAVSAEHNVGGGNLWRPQDPVTVSGLCETTPTDDGPYRCLMLDLDAPATATVYLYAIQD
jgi:hypothetical protein